MKIKTYFVNIIDVAIIFFVISIFLGFLFLERNQEISMLFDKSHNAEVVINISDETLSAKDFEVGDKIYLNDTGKSLGRISSVINMKEKKYYPVNDSLVIEYADNDVGVQLKVEAKVKENETGTYINGSYIVSPGKEVVLHTKDVSALYGVVDEVTVK